VRFRPLGSTGMHVSVQCLGTMMFGPVGNDDLDDCVEIVHAALDAGVNFVDTADMYSEGRSELIVGQALAGRRDDVILATKGHFPVGSDDPNRRGNSRRHLIRALDASLERLQTDWIDLYQVHRPDPDTAIEETLTALDDCVRAGKIRAYGCSTFPAELVVEARAAADRLGVLGFRTEQPAYSLLERRIEASVLPACQRLGMGVSVWSPLAAGWLSGRVRRDIPVGDVTHRAALQPHIFDETRPENGARLDAIEALGDLAREIGSTLPQLAVAFAVTHPGVTSAVVGPRTLEQLTGLLDAADLELDAAVLDRIDEIVEPGTSLFNAGVWRPPALDRPDLRRRPASASATRPVGARSG
jgi:aryl-alcohol dehydrogenase-like predicted oxidoreductase